MERPGCPSGSLESLDMGFTVALSVQTKAQSLVVHEDGRRAQAGVYYEVFRMDNIGWFICCISICHLSLVDIYNLWVSNGE